MGTNTNIGQETSVTVFGNPESFKKLIKNHGLLCKIKQSFVCPCVVKNNGSADYNCDICNGDGYLYAYQKSFMVTDENSRTCGKEVYPFWQPIISVEKVQNVTSEIQGGITDYTVESFTDTTITLTEEINNYEKKRVTYRFNGWTYVASDKLEVDATNGIMYTTETEYDSGYQSSNPLNAYADIADIVKIWNSDTGAEITNYTFNGNMIKTSQSIVPDKMYAEYYYSDLTQVIATDIVNRENNEVWTHDLESGETKMAFYPYWELSKGDIIVLSAVVLYKNETLKHQGDYDKLFEIEIFSLGSTIIDEDKNLYSLGTDYILQGRYVKWISSNKPQVGKILTLRYGYKPAYIIFEDQPMPNNLENKQYPVIVMAKSWSKTKKDEVAKLINS
jgi:hypothetical protein